MPLYTPRCDTRARCPCTPLADKPPPASVLSPRIGCCWLNTQLINNNLQACIRETDPFRATYMYLYPTLQISPNSYTNAAALSSALLDGTCPAILAPQSYVMNWARNPVNCPLRVKDQRARYTGDRMIGSRTCTCGAMHTRARTLLLVSVSFLCWSHTFSKLASDVAVLPASAGWVCYQGNLCIQRPIEVALQAIIQEGRVAQLKRKWLPPAACAPESASVETGGIEQIGVQVCVYASAEPLGGNETPHHTTQYTAARCSSPPPPGARETVYDYSTFWSSSSSSSS